MFKTQDVILAGYYGYNNTGDELLLKCILSDFKEIFHKYRIIVLVNSAAKNRYEKVENIIYINRYNPVLLLYYFFRSKVLIMGGGSLIQDITGKLTIYYYLFLMYLAKITGMKLVIFNQGIGPIRNRVNRCMTGIALLITDLIVVRDELSKKYIEKITQSSKEVYLGADPVFCGRIKKIQGNSQGEKKIGFAIRPWKNGNIKNLFNNVLEDLSKDEWKSYNLPFKSDDDIWKHQKIINLKWDSDEKLLEIISDLNIIVGMRLHSLMLGVLCNIPVLGIVYDPKVSSFCKFMNIPYIKISEISVERMKELIGMLYNKRVGYEKQINVLRERYSNSLEYIKNYVS